LQNGIADVPSHVWNLDESGIQDTFCPAQAVGEKGKPLYQIQHAEMMKNQLTKTRQPVHEDRPNDEEPVNQDPPTESEPVREGRVSELPVCTFSSLCPLPVRQRSTTRNRRQTLHHLTGADHTQYLENSTKKPRNFQLIKKAKRQ